MNRRQQHLQLVLLPPALFIPAHSDTSRILEALESIGDTVHPFIIYQESSDIWINVRSSTTAVSDFPVSIPLISDGCFSTQVHDIFYPFLQTSDDEITFITVNESKTGFCHLYKITSVLQRGSFNWMNGYTHSEGTQMHVG